MKIAPRLTFSLFLTCASVLVRPCAAAPGEWSLTDNLGLGRQAHTATKLVDGRVLVAGGMSFVASCELYDPATATWSFTGSLGQGRYGHTATLLPNGKVLVVGGHMVDNGQAELYDPATGVWTNTGSPGKERYGHTATLLADGRVMIVGGLNPGNLILTTPIYDPATGVWSQTGQLHNSRVDPTVTLLNDGRVMVAGGETVPSEPTDTEIWDPTTGTWSLVGALIEGRRLHTATLIPGGKVLVSGGYLANGSAIVYKECELFDPATGIWSQTGELDTGRYQFTATLLPDGKVLAAGGTGENLANLGSAEIYDPATGSWGPTGSLNLARNNHAASLLDSGMVLVEGGYDGTGMDKTSAELYDPGSATAATRVSGRGAINGQGDAATFNFRANFNGDRPSGSVTFSDPAAGITITRGKVRTLIFDGNSATLGGSARLGDRTKVTYSVTATDGSPDTFSITLSNGYAAGGTLTSGDISIQ